MRGKYIRVLVRKLLILSVLALLSSHTAFKSRYNPAPLSPSFGVEHIARLHLPNTRDPDIMDFSAHIEVCLVEIKLVAGLLLGACERGALPFERQRLPLAQLFPLRRHFVPARFRVRPCSWFLAQCSLANRQS